MEVSVLSKNLTDFFRYKRGSEIMFADREGFRCRLGLCVRTIWVSDSGFINPRPSKKEFIFAVSNKRLQDFGLIYLVSTTREINPEIPGKIILTDFIEDNSVFYYTIIFEKKDKIKPNLPEKVNWVE